MKYQGSCHCGRTRFEVQGEIGVVLECNCSHCGRKGTLWWFVPRQAMTLQTADSELSTYLFNKHVIQHRFCPTCGCEPFGLGTDPSGNPTAAINARCLEDIEIGKLKRMAYDGRSK
jgi:hypothetical protein